MTPEQFFRPLGLGVNLARMAVVEAADSPTSAPLIAEDGFGWVRSYIPARRGQPWGVPLGGEAGIRRVLDAWATFAANGLPVVGACHDIMGPDDAADPATTAHLRLVARMIAAHPGLTPDRLAVAPLNEAAGKERGGWFQRLGTFHSVLRSALPAHVLCASSHNWGDAPTALDAPPPWMDDGTALELHQYFPLDWAALAGRIGELRARTGRTVFLGELGPGHQEEREHWGSPPGPVLDIQIRPDTWPDRYAATWPVVRTVPCALWALTSDGDNWFRLNGEGGWSVSGPRLIATLGDLSRLARDANPWFAGRAAAMREALDAATADVDRARRTALVEGHRTGWFACRQALVAEVTRALAYPDAPP